MSRRWSCKTMLCQSHTLCNTLLLPCKKAPPPHPGTTSFLPSSTRHIHYRIPPIFGQGKQPRKSNIERDTTHPVIRPKIGTSSSTNYPTDIVLEPTSDPHPNTATDIWNRPPPQRTIPSPVLQSAPPPPCT